MKNLNKADANQITNRHIARLLTSIEEVSPNIPAIFSEKIKSQLHFLKKDLTYFLEWENGKTTKE